MSKLTKEEFMELYGDVQVRFQSYYKYTFTYVGRTTNGDEVRLLCGGGADDIYKWEVVADEPELVMFAGAFSGVVISKYSGKPKAEFYDY